MPEHEPIARVSHAELAGAVRPLATDEVEAAKPGHPGLPTGAADVATVLFTRFLDLRSCRSALAGPRPLGALGRPWVKPAMRFGSDAVIGPEGSIVGTTGFGASAPARDLYRHGGIAAAAVAERVLRAHNQ